MQRGAGRRANTELGPQGCQPRAYKRTTLPSEQPVTSPDLIDRAFTADALDQRRVWRHHLMGQPGCRCLTLRMGRSSVEPLAG
jgi:hypothetical protein